MTAADLLRVYLDPSEIATSGQYEGYPRAWWNPSFVSTYVRHPKWVEKYGPTEVVVHTWRDESREPEPDATHPHALLSRVEYPPIKDLIRDRDGHRCLRCQHPYLVRSGLGEWSPCDVYCTHAGPTRVVDVSEEHRPAAVAAGAEMVALQTEASWRILTVHHLNGVKEDCRWWNLVSLCQRCHLTIQAKVHMARPWTKPHSEWFRPFAAGYYAWALLGEELTREETLARMDELLALQQTQDPLF